MSREPQDDEVDYEAYLYRRPIKRVYNDIEEVSEDE